jgi:hypothetical protein
MAALVREAQAALCPAAPCRGAHGSRPRWCEPQRSLCITSQPFRQGTPTGDFRMFSRRVIERIDIELDQGFCYSIKLPVKAHRLGWRIGELRARWFERQHGTSRFRVLKWLPACLRWNRSAFATTLLRHFSIDCRIEDPANPTHRQWRPMPPSAWRFAGARPAAASP